MLLSASDRVYVGDFLISIDSGGGGAAAGDDDIPGDAPAAGAARAGCRSRRLPRRPRGRRTGSSAARFAEATTTTARTSVTAAARRTTSWGWRRGRRARGACRFPRRLPRRHGVPHAARQPAPWAGDSFDDGLGAPAGERRRGRRGHRQRGPVRRLPRRGRRERPAALRRRPPGLAPAVPAPAPAFGSASARSADEHRRGRKRRGLRGAARRRGGHADPDHRARRRAASIAASGLALHDEQPRRSERRRRRAVAAGQHRLSAAGPRQPGGRRAARRRHARLGGLPARVARRASWRPSAGRCCSSGRSPISSPAAAGTRRRCSRARSPRAATCSSRATPRRCRKRWAALAAAIPADRRVVAIGAAQPRARGGWTDLAPAADMAGLLRVAATLRADHLVLGEVGRRRGGRAVAGRRARPGGDLIAALPGRSPGETLARLAALAAAGLGATPAAAAALVAGAFDLVVQVVAVTDGTARIVEMAEPRVDGAALAAESVLALLRRRQPARSGRGAAAGARRLATARRRASPSPGARCRPRSSASEPTARAARPAGRRLFFDHFRAALARLPAGLIRVMPPASAEDLARAEAALGATLPDDLRARFSARSTAPICFTRRS